LQDELADMNMRTTVHIMQSSGGVTTAQSARKNPVFTLLSGPVGGTIAGTALSKATGRPNLLCVDMGGTSFDLSLVIDGKANATLETELEGLPLLMSIVDIQTIGTGGGSIAWMEGSAMRVGPHSAGSVPGPACYGRGGTQPTVTDANLFLGRLGAKSLLGGDMSLDEAAAAKAIESVAPAAGLDPVAFAEGILAISNAAMADAMRTITVSQGVDPREFTLVAFGGAGPMAAVFLAQELDINEVLVPRFPGTFSAWGMLQTNLRHDLTKNFFHPASNDILEEMRGVFTSLETDGREIIAKEGIAEKDISFLRAADMRYFGQEYSINVTIPVDADITRCIADFHAAHDKRYGHSNPKAPVEFVNLRVAAFGMLEKYSDGTATSIDAQDPSLGAREIVFNSERFNTPIVARDRLAPGYSSLGPLIVEEQSATTVVPPGWTTTVDDVGNLILHRSER
jgi:N-methylhydantoinase A